jgi:hypothetical protein
MELSDRLKKLIIFAMDSGATENERSVAASMAFREFRKDYSDGHILIEALEAAVPESADADSQIDEIFENIKKGMYQTETKIDYSDQPCPFGAHRGKPLRDVPTSWMRWACKLPDLFPQTRKMFEAELRKRGAM